ncbi:sce7725 family protein [Clostridioides difficile]|nr:hypothetical protein KW95_13355 [Clostridioides difficile]
MYLPYLRGRQFELIALRELVKNNLIGNKIIPIIEPIKLTSTLTKTLEVFSEKNRMLSIIMNPKLSNFINELDTIENNTINNKFSNEIKKENIIKSYIVNENILNELSDSLEIKDLLIINRKRDDIEYFLKIFHDNVPKYTLIPEDRTFKRKVKGNKILLEDKFNRQDRNADYLVCNDEFFSEDHLYFKSEDFKGFSDYSIVGDNYSESGFAPYAVAIHIVYFSMNSDNELELRIKHFVSQSNDDISNPAGKFEEALTKLINWINTEQSKPSFKSTFALEEFIKYYNTGSYPGLGTVKKLSIMHHIQLMNFYLEGEF